MRFWAGLILALVMALPAAAQVPGAPHHVATELVADRQGIAPGETIHVALRQQIEKHWHTYWRNSGDSGEPTRIKWDLPTGWQAGGFTWAAPQKIAVGPLMNYGYEGEVLLPMTLTAPANARPGDKVTLKADVSLLVCAEVCVPEDDALSLTLPVTAGPAPADPKWAGPIAAALAAAPKPAGLTAAFQTNATGHVLAIAGPPLNGAEIREAYVYPYDPIAIDHAKPQAIDRGKTGLTLTLPLAPGYSGRPDGPLRTFAGVLAVDGKTYEIDAPVGPPPPGASGLGPPMAKAVGGADLGLAAAAVFAFLGGLILNLMPCVFPIPRHEERPSLAGHGEDQSEARKQGLAFGGGSVLTFLALAGGLIALKAAGSAVGWGFQLQSPPVVAVLALLMLAVALNLSGLFEVGSSLQGGGLQASPAGAARPGPSSPARWPWWWRPPARRPSWVRLWAGRSPRRRSRRSRSSYSWAWASPRPSCCRWCLCARPARAPTPAGSGPSDGKTFRKALAFPMYGAPRSTWLAWVLAQQAPPEDLAKLFAAAVLVALAGWLVGAACCCC